MRRLASRTAPSSARASLGIAALVVLGAALMALGVATLAVLVTAPPVATQEIVQAVMLDLTTIEVQVIVAGTRGDERVRCLLRGASDRVRVAVERPVSGGFTSGRTTLLSLPLPLLEAGEREFSVVLVRDEVVFARTDWRPIFTGR